MPCHGAIDITYIVGACNVWLKPKGIKENEKAAIVYCTHRRVPQEMGGRVQVHCTIICHLFFCFPEIRYFLTDVDAESIFLLFLNLAN